MKVSTTMKTLTFIRHAESLANAGGVTMPNDQIPLSPYGHNQARQLADLLDVTPSSILVSVFPRTQETARPFCERVAMVPVVHPLLHEFCTIDPVLIAGMDLEQRRPITEGYWNEADPDKRMGEDAETFHEFAARVAGFEKELDGLADATVIFGHGMWLALLVWHLLGFSTQGSSAMRAFRRFQLALPMPNCAVYALERSASGNWSARANVEIARRFTSSITRHTFR
jgi:broad specificity phosphatase PhoE